jgi:hypothetical protein
VGMSTDHDVQAAGTDPAPATSADPAPPGPGTDPRLDAALERLVVDGTLAPEQAVAVGSALAPLLPATAPGAPPPTGVTGPRHPAPALRTRLAEIAGYVGAALVVGAAFFFVSEQWDELSTGGRIGILVGIAAILAVAAIAVVLTAPGRLASVRSGDEPVRRRLVSTLATGAAASVAFAAGVALEAGTASEQMTVLVAALSGLAVVAAGYTLAPSLVGQLGGAAAAVVATTSAVSIGDTSGSSEVGLGLFGLGLAWAVLVAVGVLRERLAGTIVAGALALLGAQLLYADEGTRPWSYVLTLLVVLVAFATYTRRPSWPLLGVGVVGATVLVPEFLSDLTGGSLGVSGVMLAAGVALLASSAVGLRLRREVSS